MGFTVRKRLGADELTIVRTVWCSGCRLIRSIGLGSAESAGEPVTSNGPAATEAVAAGSAAEASD